MMDTFFVLRHEYVHPDALPAFEFVVRLMTGIRENDYVTTNYALEQAGERLTRMIAMKHFDRIERVTSSDGLLFDRSLWPDCRSSGRHINVFETCTRENHFRKVEVECKRFNQRFCYNCDSMIKMSLNRVENSLSTWNLVIFHMIWLVFTSYSPFCLSTTDGGSSHEAFDISMGAWKRGSNAVAGVSGLSVE
jgi:hypothetical protein